jgi:hypothetical protein
MILLGFNLIIRSRRFDSYISNILNFFNGTCINNKFTWSLPDTFRNIIDTITKKVYNLLLIRDILYRGIFCDFILFRGVMKTWLFCIRLQVVPPAVKQKRG